MTLVLQAARASKETLALDALVPQAARAAQANKETRDRKATRDSREKKEIKEKKAIKEIAAKPDLIKPLQWRERLRRQRRRACRLRRRRYQLLSRRPGAVLAPLGLLESLGLRAIRGRPARLLPSKDPPGTQGNHILVRPAGPARRALLVRRVLLVLLDPQMPNY